MSLHYAMVLVPDDPYVRPTARAISQFLAGLVDIGAAGQEQKAAIVKYTGGPPSGQRLRERTPLGSLDELASAADGCSDFDAVLDCRGATRVVPIRHLGCDEAGQWRALDYSIEQPAGMAVSMTIDCCQRATLHSTSDVHEDAVVSTKAPTRHRCLFERLFGSRLKRATVPFGEPCDSSARLGRYTNPETGELIEVPASGCSTFWISIQLDNKFVFPRFEANEINFVEPSVMHVARTALGVGFVEACRWG